MAAKKVELVADPQVAPREVQGPIPLWEQLGMVPGQPVGLRAGQGQLRVKVGVTNTGGGPDPGEPGQVFRLRLHPATLAHIAIPGERLRTHVRVDGGDGEPTLRIGPFVGVFGQRGRGPTPFGPHELYFRCLSSFGRPLGVTTYIFSARDVEWDQKFVRGFQWSRKGRLRGWRQEKFPIPDVVFDRLLSRRAEWQPRNQLVRKRFAAMPGVTYFNPGFFDKWLVHHRLAQQPELAPYLPATERFESPAQFRAFLRRYPVVFLKPTGGSLGLGIISVRRRGERYDCSISSRVGNLRRHFVGFGAMARWLARYMGKREYLMQQGIPLARWAGRPVDFRIIMQKDTGGRWEMTKGFARIAAPGSVTSNLSGGGTAKKIGTMLRAMFGRRRGRALTQGMLEAVRTLTPVIEQQIPGTIGELGLDLCVDRRGRLWILEVNSKPFLQVTPGSGTPQAIRLSVVRPLRWSRFVSGFEPATAGGEGDVR